MDLASLETRLIRLERQNFLLKCMLSLLLCVGGFLSCRIPVDDATTVVAQSFVLRDATGKVRGEWASSQELLPSENGAETVASITCLRLRDSEGGLAFQACGRWDANTASGLLLSDTTGARVSLNADGEGASLSVGNQRTPDKPRPPHVGLAADADSASVFVATGGPRATILTLDELTMRDESGHVFLRLPEKAP